MKNKPSFTVIKAVILIVGMFGIWGWVWNIIKIATGGFDPITGMIVLRIIGVCMAPLGAVLGFV